MKAINKTNRNIYSILKGFGISLILSVIFIWIYALILVKTNIQENTIVPVIMVISSVSILIGSSASCLKVKKNGILNGACVGGLYFITLYLLSSIALCGFGFNVKSLLIITLGIAFGGIGGIIGVNIRKWWVYVINFWTVKIYK